MPESCQKEFNLKSCACTYPGCPRKGRCCECVRNHSPKGEFTACFFTAKGEKTFDRSFAMLVKDRQ